jgi:hypothetical protein
MFSWEGEGEGENNENKFTCQIYLYKITLKNIL